jgi:hypothetical protein
VDRWLSRVSGKLVPVDGACRGRGFVSGALPGLHRKHFREHLVARHNFSWSHSWTKTFLHSKGLLEKVRRASAQAAASADAGDDVLHQDGSRHEWLEGQPPLDLILNSDPG